MAMKTEYNRNYQWDRTWKNAPHPRDNQSVNIQTRKPTISNKKLQVEIKPRDKSLESEISRIRSEIEDKKRRLNGKIQEKPVEKKLKPIVPAVVDRPKTAPPKEEVKQVARPAKKWRHYPDSFVTEYQVNFKPIVYSSSQHNLNKEIDPKKERLCVLPPRAHEVPARCRSMSPRSAAKCRFITTYDNTFGRASLKRPQSALNVSRDELNQTRQKAQFYKYRDHASHFSRNHLVQLASEEVNFWSPDYEDNTIRPSLQQKLYYNLPPAGVPGSRDSISMEKVFAWDDDFDYKNPNHRYRNEYSQYIPAGKPSYDAHSLMSEYYDTDWELMAQRDVSDVASTFGSVTNRSSIISSISMAQETLKRAREQQQKMESYRLSQRGN